ncbi:MAG: 30S ribosomal protein S12 methylthiotransferase RimO [Flavobacteriia bacterium]|nr:30S ribosomal protein S12 methylthiotransferase RimO [Flavobacteriia bacterium]
MKTKSLHRKKINLVTLGCSKNLFDSEVLMGQLRANGRDVVHEGQSGEVVVINTCGFIDNAKQESIDTILDYARLKEEGQVEKVYVTGCLSERYKEDLRQEIPDIDDWYGTRELPRLLKTLGADYKKELLGERILTTPAHYAYLKISEGCDRPCSFCAIPLMRGGHRSTPIEDLVEQAGKLASQGVRELILIAQDLTYYGLDLYKKRALADLLRKLVEVEGIEWIRLHYLFPTGFPLDVLQLIREEPKICTYIDIPLQHIADPVLKSMRRGTTKAKTDALLKTIRQEVPGIAIRTTLITGYPGETEDDFEILCDWVRESRFERLGCFTYSHEEDTHAFSLEDDVPQGVKEERARRIMDIQRDISTESNAELIGRELKVLVDRFEGGQFIGRTEFDSPEVDNEVAIRSGESHLRVGDFCQVEITSATEYDLQGRLL